MERYTAHAIDEVGRFVLHGDLRRKLGVEESGKVSLLIVDTIVIMQRMCGEPEQGCIVSPVNDIGMVDLPKELREKLGWQVKDKLAAYSTDNLVILKLAEKN
jgi:bifunctional DNA-binding transcriptional regulator/antitoxin component of YhaV-PrlF toxin-antitoxin module